MGSVARLLAGRLAGHWTLLFLWLLVTVVTLAVQQGPPDLQQTLVVALINLVVVVGTYLFIGLSGVMSFGHLAFMAVGAYAAALVRIPEATKDVLLPNLPGFLATVEVGVIPSLLIGGAAAALLAAVLAFPLMRLNGLSAGIASFAVLLVINVVATNWTSLTGGVAGLQAVPVATTATSALVWALLAIGVAYLFQRSASGTRLRAAREDEIAAAGAGVNIVRERSVGFVLSAFVVGVGGGLYGQLFGAFNPDAFYLSTTFLVLAMLIVGGVRTLTGAVFGALFISVVAEVLARLEAGQHVGPFSVPARPGIAAVGLGLILLAALVLRPSGLAGRDEWRWPFGPTRPSGGSAQPESRPGPRVSSDERAAASR